jgi:alanine dehydrogenase
LAIIANEGASVKIGVPKEKKVHEYRVGMTPAAVREAVARGREVLVETAAGNGIGCGDEDYTSAGAAIAPAAEAVFADAQLIVKVKEPQPDECRMLRPGQVLFAYLHLAADREQTRLLCESECTAIAYETISDRQGGLPLLAPMSEVAGRMSVQVGAVAIQKPNGGSGVILGGVPGTQPAKVTILGGGVVGANAARMAVGLEADVTLFDRSLPRLRWLADLCGNRLKTRFATIEEIHEAVVESDLVIGAVLLPGAAAPKLVSSAQLRKMRPGSVLVDVAIDQGGCFETSQPTTHNRPTYVVDDIVHYCVANIRGAAPRTSTFALNNATLPFTLALADLGCQRACEADAGLAAAVNIHQGRIVHSAVAETVGTC